MALLLRNAPHFPPPWFQFVFFNACRTLSPQIVSTTSSQSHQLFCQHLHGPPNAAFQWNRTGHLNQTPLPPPHPASSAPEAPAEACAPEPSSDPAPPPAAARAGRSAPSRPAESVHAAASSPTPHDACSTSAPLPTHPAHPKLTPPCIASASNPPDPRTPSSPPL